MKNIILILLLIFCLNNHLFSQSQGPLNPASSGTDVSVGTITWANTGNIFISDNTRSTAVMNSNGDVTYYLSSTNFGFSIPTSSTVNGIVVEIEISDNSGGGTLKDNSIKIIKGGAIVGTEKANIGNWSSTDTYKTYGSATDLWGVGWTYNDINATNFGVVISAKRTGGGANNQGMIDHIRITVYYTAPLPVELLYFKGTSKNNSIELNWETASEFNNDYFIVYKSSDGLYFNKIITIKGAGNSNTPLSYTLVDNEPYHNITYYKLTQFDYNGNFESFDIISVYNTNTSVSKLVKITNVLGQEINNSYDYIKLYYFSDGSVIKKYIVK